MTNCEITPGEVITSDDLYHATTSDLLELLTSLNPCTRTTLVIGHEPALSRASSRIAQHHDDAEQARSYTHAMATRWTTRENWPEIPRAARLQRVFAPRHAST